MPRVRKVPPPAVQMQPGSNQQLPASAPTGMPYGERKATMDAQQQVPMGTGSTQPPPMAPADGAGLPPLDFGSIPDINAESEFPDEPITTGLPVGPGLGPEALVRPSAGRVANTLGMIADLTGDEQLIALAQAARMQGI